MASKTNDKDNQLIKGTSKADSIDNEGANVTISAGAGNDSIYNRGSNVSISGGTGNDVIDNAFITDGFFSSTMWIGVENVTINGGAGNDLIRNYGNNSIIEGGTGNDSIYIAHYISDSDDFDKNALVVYNAGDGNDIIYGFRADSTLKIDGSYSTTKSGSDIIVTVGEGKVTLQRAAYLETVNIVGDKALTLTNSSKAAVTVPASIFSADATARTTGIKITGNALDNSILGGTGKDTLYGKDGNDYLAGGSGVDKLYGGNGNDTLIGGAGNDSLWGNDGADTFVYNSGDGKDVIVSFANDDLLQITGTFSASVNSAGSVIFKVGSTASAITLKNYTAETFNINGDNYQISGTKLVKK